MTQKSWGTPGLLHLWNTVSALLSVENTLWVLCARHYSNFLPWFASFLSWEQPYEPGTIIMPVQRCGNWGRIELTCSYIVCSNHLEPSRSSHGKPCLSHLFAFVVGCFLYLEPTSNHLTWLVPTYILKLLFPQGFLLPLPPRWVRSPFSVLSSQLPCCIVRTFLCVCLCTKSSSWQDYVLLSPSLQVPGMAQGIAVAQ